MVPEPLKSVWSIRAEIKPSVRSEGIFNAPHTLPQTKFFLECPIP